jgi:hypothetical protein
MEFILKEGQRRFKTCEKWHIRGFFVGYLEGCLKKGKIYLLCYCNLTSCPSGRKITSYLLPY